MISSIIITDISKISKWEKCIQVKSKPCLYISDSYRLPIIYISVILFKRLSKISHHINKEYSVQPYFQRNDVPLWLFFKTDSVDKIVNNIKAPK